MIVFWVLTIILCAIALFCLLIASLGVFDSTTEHRFEAITYSFLFFAFFTIVEITLVNNYDYSEKAMEKLYPEDVTILNKEHSVEIKYYDFYHVIDSKPELPKAQDSCFYINRIAFFDIFGNYETTNYEVVITNKRIFKPIKI